MNLYKILLYPLILTSSNIGRMLTQETSYPAECNKINFNAGYFYGRREYLNYKNQAEFDACIPIGSKASIDCGMFKNLIIGCEALNAPSRLSSFDNQCGNHMIKKGKDKFRSIGEIQKDPCLNKYKDDEFYPLGEATGTLADKVANRKGRYKNY